MSGVCDFIIGSAVSRALVLVATNLSGEGQITVGYSIKYYEQIPV